MQRVPLTRPVKDVLSDGQRYIIWGRRFTSQVTVFDAVTEKQRVIQLPAGCRQSHGIGQAAAGLLILYCRQGAEYGVELRTGRARRFGVGFPTYTNSGVGTRWVRGFTGAEGTGGLQVFENRRTGVKITKPVYLEASPRTGGYPMVDLTEWDLDQEALRVRQFCGRPATGSDPPSSWTAGDYYRLYSPDSNWQRLRVSRCGGHARTLEGTRRGAVQLDPDLVTWSDYCDDTFDERPIFPGCLPMVKAENLTSQRRSVWRLPYGSYRTAIGIVARAGRWIYAAREDGGGGTPDPDDSAGTYLDDHVYALYRARIPETVATGP